MRFESSFGGKEGGGGVWGNIIYFQTFCDLDNSSFPCFFHGYSFAFGVQKCIINLHLAHP